MSAACNATRGPWWPMCKDSVAGSSTYVPSHVSDGNAVATMGAVDCAGSSTTGSGNPRPMRSSEGARTVIAAAEAPTSPRFEDLANRRSLRSRVPFAAVAWLARLGRCRRIRRPRAWLV